MNSKFNLMYEHFYKINSLCLFIRGKNPHRTEMSQGVSQIRTQLCNEINHNLNHKV